MTAIEDERMPTYEELVAQVAAIDERVDMIDRLLFDEPDAEDDEDDGD